MVVLRPGVGPDRCWGAGCGITGRGRALVGHAVLAAGRLGSCPALLPCGSSGGGRRWPRSFRRRGRWRVASTLQIVLGIVALVYLLPFDGTPRPVSFYQAVVRTGHQTNGALLAGGDGRADLRVVSSSVARSSVRPCVRELEDGIGAAGGAGRIAIGRPLLEIDGVDRSTAAGRRRARTTCWPRSAAALAAYVSLTKPRLVLLVLVTVAVGFLLGRARQRHPATLRDAGGDAAGHRAGGRGCRRAQPVAGARPRCPDAADGQPRPAQRAAALRRRRRSSAACSSSWGRRSCSWGRTCWRPRSPS